jgi:hypothetical protein
MPAMKNTALMTIYAIVASILIVAYLLGYPDMGDVKLDTKCFLSHIDPCTR